ncbi:MAG TPA: DUF2624 family protein [Pseudogracilibacillus sp.]|nr:DUF2624 family protein [Pseudogracilibacillus sp.]
MSVFLKELITNKLKKLSSEEVLHYGQQYGFKVSKREATEITNFLKSNPIDPFNSCDRKKAFQELAKITSNDTAAKAENLFIQLISSYGLDSLFN